MPKAQPLALDFDFINFDFQAETTASAAQRAQLASAEFKVL